MTIAITFYAFFKLINALVPRKDVTRDSLIFFGAIAGKYSSWEKYKEDVDKQSINDFKEDLYAQVYAASKICAKKFENYKKGIICSSVGILLFAILTIVTVLVSKC